jgi:hypothetical protein
VLDHVRVELLVPGCRRSESSHAGSK